MYDKLQNVLSAHRTYAAALTALYELVHAEKRASKLMHPSSWNVYNAKLAVVQQHRTASYSVMESLLRSAAHQAAVTLFGQGEYLIDKALQAQDPEDCETGAAAMRVMADAKLAFQVALSDIKGKGEKGTIRGCSTAVAKAIRAEIEAAAVVRSELSEVATTLGLAEKQDFKNARADYHSALSSLETKLDALEALLKGAAGEELGKAFETFVAFVQAQAGTQADKDSDWQTYIKMARPLFV